MTMPQPATDQWAQWLLHRRFAGDPEQLQNLLAMLYPVRDRVLRNADLKPRDVLLDVGTGDGLLAFGALAQVGGQGQAIFSDISQDLLSHCQGLARAIGAEERCRFLLASADDLHALGDCLVDAVTTRSVLIYVKAKQQAFHEFYRVLKPGGRISLFEPINRVSYPEAPHLFSGYGITPVMEIAHKVRDYYDAVQPPESSPMLDFDERDLVAFAEKAGFQDIHLDLELRVTASPRRDWETLIHTSFNPLWPTLAEAMQVSLTPDEATQLTTHMRPLVEAGQGTYRSAYAYLWATKDA